MPLFRSEQPWEPSESRYITRYYITLIFVFLGLGGVLILGSAWWDFSSKKNIHAEVIGELRNSVPRLLSKEEGQVVAILEKWEGRWSQENLIRTIIRDFGIALIVAAFLTLAIEIYTKTKLISEVRKGVLEATFQKIIPEVIFREVQAHIIKARVLRKGWDIHLSVHEDENVSRTHPDCYVTRTVTRYKIHNLVNQAHEHTITSALDLSSDCSDAVGKLPRYEKVQIGAETYGVGGKDLKKILTDDGAGYRVQALLPKSIDEPVVVINEIRDILRVPDTFAWWTSIQAEGGRLTIDSFSVPALKFEVKPLHPNRVGIEEPVKGRMWEFHGGFLPWQGFEIRVWKERLALPQAQVAETAVVG